MDASHRQIHTWFLARLFPWHRRGKAPQKITAAPRYPFSVMASIALLAVVFLISLAADVAAPHHYASQNLSARLSFPSLFGGTSEYLLGTDFLGRDIFSRLLYATRISVAVAIIGTVISGIIGITLGLIAVHFKGWIEEFIMVVVDFQAAMPFILIALAVLTLFGNSLFLFILLMGLHGWERYARLTRGLVLTIQKRGYIVAVRSFGASSVRLYGKHILPNIAAVLIVQFTLNFSQTVLLETSLSFLGLGVQPPLTSLGSMLGEGRNYLMSAWWISVAPGMVIFWVTLSSCLVGDWLRDKLDPALR